MRNKAKKVARKKVAKAKPRASSANRRFVDDLLIRGEAASLTQGKLPLEATHVIEGKNADGSTAVRRLRFKTF